MSAQETFASVGLPGMQTPSMSRELRPVVDRVQPDVSISSWTRVPAPTKKTVVDAGCDMDRGENAVFLAGSAMMELRHLHNAPERGPLTDVDPT